MANIGTNKGGKSFQDRVLASEVRSLALDEIKKVLTGDDEEYKKALVLKLSTSILPRINEISGPDGGVIPLPLLGGLSNDKSNFNNKETPKAKEED